MDKRHALAQRRAKVGGDSFDLRHGLRPPRNAFERVNVDFLQGRITQDQFREAWKADAGRLIDIEMLNAFCNAYEDRLQSYGRMLQAVVAIATDQREPDAWRRREAEADRHVEEMEAKLPLWGEQVGTVFTFLTELQADRNGEPVQCGDHSAASAHALANLVIDHAAGGWRGCKKIAAQSRTDPRYLYATSASHLFYKVHLPGLPRPNDLMSLMALERAAALKVLRERQRSAEAAPPAPASIKIHAETINVTTPNVNVTADRGLDNKTVPESDWRAVQGRLLEICQQGEPYTSVRMLADRLGCAPGTISKALKRSPKLRTWKAQKTRGRPKARSLTAPVAESIACDATDPANMLPDDEVDKRMKFLIAQAKPAERARLVAMGKDARRRLVEAASEQAEDLFNEDHAPKGNRTLGRKP